MRTAGVILDIYDDAKGLVLREKLAGADLPKPLAESTLLSREKLASLPDRLFALVAQDGAHVIRKYAMHDAEHLTTSIIYFLECGRELLPEPAQKVAAANLVNACAWYDITPPEPLVKVAILGKALGIGMAGATVAGAAAQAKEGMSQTKAEQDRYRQIQMSGQVPMDGGHIKQNSDQEFLFDQMLEGTGAKAPEAAKTPKTADLNGTEIMSNSGSLQTKPELGSNTAKRRSNATSSKNASWHGPVDITGLSAPKRVKEATYEHFCLEDRYPIDSYAQVKQAEAYFDEHWGAFDPEERRVYALNLVERASDLGIKVAGRALDYYGYRPGPHLRSELQKRAYCYGEHPDGGVYEELKTKVASMPADMMVSYLAWADARVGADQSYDKPHVGFRDPFAAVYGVKVAKSQITGDDDSDRFADNEEQVEYTWNMGADYVTGDQLRYMANRNEELDGVLGEGFSKEFNKDPVGTFKALPDPQKHVLARLASDNSGGTFRQ